MIEEQRTQVVRGRKRRSRGEGRLCLARVGLAALLGALVMVGGWEASAGDTPRESEPQRSISGTAVELYTGRPFAGRRMILELGGGGTGRCRVVARTDREGRFRLDEVPVCGEISDERVLGLWGKPCPHCPAARAVDRLGVAVRPGLSGPELGTVFVPDWTRVVRDYAPTCTIGARLPTRPGLAVDLVTLVRDSDTEAGEGSWRVLGGWRSDKADRLVPWPALLCLDTRADRVGTYGRVDDPLSGPFGGLALPDPFRTTYEAYKVTTVAQLVRLADQKVFVSRFRFRPPSVTDRLPSGPTFHPNWPRIEDWLGFVSAENPSPEVASSRRATPTGPASARLESPGTRLPSVLVGGTGSIELTITNVGGEELSCELGLSDSTGTFALSGASSVFLSPGSSSRRALVFAPQGWGVFVTDVVCADPGADRTSPVLGTFWGETGIGEERSDDGPVRRR